MIIKDLKIVKGKKGNYFTVKFSLDHGRGLKTKNWTTIYFKKEKHYFNNVIYRYDTEKQEAYEYFYNGCEPIKSPETTAYFNYEKTEKIINKIFNCKEFKELSEKHNFNFDINYLYHKKEVSKRIKNLKKIITVALSRDENIGAIWSNAEHYIALPAIDIALELKDDIESYRVDGEEGLDAFFKTCLHNKYAVRMSSFIEDFVNLKGEQIDDIGDFIFAWEFPADVLYYDEILEDIVRLSAEILKESKKIITPIGSQDDDYIIDEFDCDLFDVGYIIDTVIHPELEDYINGEIRLAQMELEDFYIHEFRKYELKPINVDSYFDSTYNGEFILLEDYEKVALINYTVPYSFEDGGNGSTKEFNSALTISESSGEYSEEEVISIIEMLDYVIEEHVSEYLEKNKLK